MPVTSYSVYDNNSLIYSGQNLRIAMMYANNIFGYAKVEIYHNLKLDFVMVNPNDIWELHGVYHSQFEDIYATL